MPYDFGNAWGQIGADLGAKITGRPSARQAKDADRALAIKMAQDKSDYEKEQDKIKNFAAYGGYDPAQVMAGSTQDAILSDADLAGFQANMATPDNMVMQAKYKDASKFNPGAERAFRGFQEKLGSRGLNFEQRKELERLHAEETRRTKGTQSGGTVDKYGNMGAGASAEPLEDTTDYNGPFDWRHPFKTFGKGEKPAGGSGMIKVKLKSTGQTGSVSPDKFDPSLYDKIQ